MEVETCLFTKVGEFVGANADVDAAPMIIAADTDANFTMIDFMKKNLLTEQTQETHITRQRFASSLSPGLHTASAKKMTCVRIPYVWRTV